MPCCLFYCHLASQLDPKPLKQASAFWFSYTKKEEDLCPGRRRNVRIKILKNNSSSHCELGPPVVYSA